MSEEKGLKIVFVPGCFDNFDGTQEELDTLIEDLKQMAASGELQRNSVPVEDIPDHILEKLDDFVADDDFDLNKSIEEYKKKLN